MAWCEKNQLAVIDILQCIVFGDMVDTFGDVPYKAANDLAGNPLPAYDKAADIYTDLIARVTKDVADLDTSFASFGNADVIYKGSLDNGKIWKLIVAKTWYYIGRC